MGVRDEGSDPCHRHIQTLQKEDVFSKDFQAAHSIRGPEETGHPCRIFQSQQGYNLLFRKLALFRGFGDQVFS